MLALVAGGLLGAAAVVQSLGAEGSDPGPTPPSPPPAPAASSADSASVPDVGGMTEAEAVRTLAASGLVANVRRRGDVAPTGRVLASEPPAAVAVGAGSVVVLSLAPPRPRSTPGPTDEQELHALGALVDAHPEAFVGLYRDDAGTAIVVFGPGVDGDAWRERLTAAAGGAVYRVETCTHSRRALGEVQAEIARGGWRAAGSTAAFGVWVDPSTCTVRVESDLLTAADVEELARRFGSAVSLDTSVGSHPELASG